MAANRKRLTIHHWDQVTVLDLGNIEIWDGADLALLRETLTQLIEVENCRSVGINMRYAKYIPSGFFGMLFDWHEKGVAVHLYTPQPNVHMMLWFRQFFDHIADGCHLLQSKPKHELTLSVPSELGKMADWDKEKKMEMAGRPDRN